jgi:hypothetical protein
MVIDIGIYVVYMESIVEWNLWKFSMNAQVMGFVFMMLARIEYCATP